MSQTIKPEGKVLDLIRKNVGALYKGVVNNGEMMLIDFTGLYVERQHDLIRVDVYFPDGKIQMVDGEVLKLETTVDAEYKYELGGYNVNTWWDRFIGESGEEVIIRGTWPGYTIVCKFYTEKNDPIEAKIYLQIKYKEFSKENNFTLCDSQLLDDGNVSYLFKTKKDGTMFCVGSGEYVEEKVAVNKISDYPDLEKEGLDDYEKWNWKTDDNGTITREKVKVEGTIVSLRVSNEVAQDLTRVMLRFVDCMNTHIEAGNYSEEIIDISNVATISVEGDYTTISYDMGSIIDSAHIYRVRFSFEGFDGRAVHSMPSVVCVDAPPNNNFVCQYNTEDIIDGVCRARKFDLRIMTEYLILYIGELVDSSQTEDYWIPNDFYYKRRISDVINDIKDYLTTGTGDLSYLPKNKKQQCDELLENIKRYMGYWQYLQVFLGDDITKFRANDGVFSLCVKVGDYYKSIDSLLDGNHDEELRQQNGVCLVYTYQKNYFVKDFIPEVEYYLSAYVVNVAAVGDVQGMAYEVYSSTTPLRFELPLSEDYVKFAIHKDQHNKREIRFVCQFDDTRLWYKEDVSSILVVAHDENGNEVTRGTVNMSHYRVVSDIEEIKSYGFSVSETEDDVLNDGKTLVEYRVEGEYIKDFEGCKIYVTLICGSLDEDGKGNILTFEAEGVSFSYLRPQIDNVVWGCYNKLVEHGGVSKYRLQMFVKWETINENYTTNALVELLDDNDDVVDYGYCGFYEKDGVRAYDEENYPLHKLFFFINFNISEKEIREGYRLRISLKDIEDLFERNAVKIVDGVSCYDDYIMEYGYHPAFGTQDVFPFTQSIDNLSGFYYAWDMFKRFEILDTLKGIGSHIYYEVLTNPDGSQRLEKRAIEDIKRYTIAPFCLSYQVSMNAKSKIRVGDYLYDVFHQTGDNELQTKNNTNTYYRKRVFRDGKEGQDFYRFDTVPIFMTKNTREDEFVPVVQQGVLSYKRLENNDIRVEDLPIDEYGDLKKEAFERDYEHLTFSLQKRQFSKAVDLVWVSEEKPEMGKLIVIHDFNSYRTLRNITDKMEIESKDIVREREAEGGEEEKETYTETKTLYVGKLSMPYFAEKKYNVVLVNQAKNNKTTYLVWQVDGSTGEIQSFNSNSLEY